MLPRCKFACCKTHPGLCCLQIRATFHLPDDLTDEEKLEPIKNLGEDPRIRLLNRLYAKRRKASPASVWSQNEQRCGRPCEVQSARGVLPFAVCMPAALRLCRLHSGKIAVAYEQRTRSQLQGVVARLRAVLPVRTCC